MTTRRISFTNLEALRGLLAVYVAVGHSRWLLWGGHAAWLASAYSSWEVAPAYASAAFRYGREAVMVFFVLSGFFIHFQAASACSPGSVQPSASSFYRRRWHRLAPPYFFALAITILCDVIGRTWWPTLYLSRTGDALIDQTFDRGGYAAASVLPALIVLPSSLGRDFGSNGPLWSLGFEAIYYALYPAWLWLRRRSAVAAFGVIPLGCFALTFLPISAFLLTVLMHYPIWLAGAFVAERLRAAGIGPLLPLAAAGLFLAGAVLHVMSQALLPGLIAALMFGSGAVLFCAITQTRNTISAAAEFFGFRSYTIYAVHFPLLTLISAYVFHTYGERPLYGWLAVLGAMVAVGFGCLCFEACERHFLHSRYRDESAAP